MAAAFRHLALTRSVRIQIGLLLLILSDFGICRIASILDHTVIVADRFSNAILSLLEFLFYAFCFSGSNSQRHTLVKHLKCYFPDIVGVEVGRQQVVICLELLILINKAL